MNEQDLTRFYVVRIPEELINRDLCMAVKLTPEELIRSQLRPALVTDEPTCLGGGKAVTEDEIIITLG